MFSLAHNIIHRSVLIGKRTLSGEIGFKFKTIRTPKKNPSEEILITNEITPSPEVYIERLEELKSYIGKDAFEDPHKLRRDIQRTILSCTNNESSLETKVARFREEYRDFCNSNRNLRIGLGGVAGIIIFSSPFTSPFIFPFGVMCALGSIVPSNPKKYAHVIEEPIRDENHLIACKLGFTYFEYNLSDNIREAFKILRYGNNEI